MSEDALDRFQAGIVSLAVGTSDDGRELGRSSYQTSCPECAALVRITTITMVSKVDLGNGTKVERLDVRVSVDHGTAIHGFSSAFFTGEEL